jgi:hypothetical protein
LGAFIYIDSYVGLGQNLVCLFLLLSLAISWGKRTFIVSFHFFFFSIRHLGKKICVTECESIKRANWLFFFLFDEIEKKNVFIFFVLCAGKPLVDSDGRGEKVRNNFSEKF